MRLQMTSDFTTKSHDSLNSAQKAASSSAVCCSLRIAITFDARAFASSAAEDRMSESSSWRAGMSTGAPGDLEKVLAQLTWPYCADYALYALNDVDDDRILPLYAFDTIQQAFVHTSRNVQESRMLHSAQLSHCL